jgi:putative ABC transport system ATP-binding protein
MTSTRPASAAADVVKIYGHSGTAVRALDKISVEFAAGSFTAIMGPSGSGKSTLMHCLAGLDTVTSGSVWLGGRELTSLPDRALTLVRREHVGFVFQSFNLLPTLTAAQNIVLPLEMSGRSVDRSHFDALTTSLGITDRLGHRPGQLSGGQQQRVAIARSLITRPDVVFADEPTGALDLRTGQALLSYLRTNSRETGQTIVLVTHDPLAASYADRVVVLADGRLADDLQHPTADDVLTAVRILGG